MDFNVVRWRAGIVHIFVWMILINIIFLDYSLKPIVIFMLYDFLAAAIFGITPLSVTGSLGWLFTQNKKPKWKVVSPLRFT